ncbi:mobilisation protein (MobC) [Hydrobacter penzbergensis]|uniref:Mobilisation protein (MobC) n=1 Tax=Hydrobacter penzbergensis TaxID=1235997 RepID=A0A8X8LHD7_9BACT|nr:plasmid mobilization relaxosome protein MobC [Hydrobacter penzbergensis]SDX68478.1 mobilisation protein (MobC) [Hydrobacter penzbergensis]
METVSKKQKKAGRPVKTIKKEIRACVRFTRHEYFIIREKAAQAGVNASIYIRQTTIQGKIIPRLTADEVQTVRQLIGMSVNINQVAKICHRDGLFEAMQYFEHYRNLIDGLLKKLKS